MIRELKTRVRHTLTIFNFLQPEIYSSAVDTVRTVLPNFPRIKINVLVAEL